MISFTFQKVIYRSFGLVLFHRILKHAAFLTSSDLTYLKTNVWKENASFQYS